VYHTWGVGGKVVPNVEELQHKMEEEAALHQSIGMVGEPHL